MEEKIILKRSDVEQKMNEAHEKVIYWEKCYRIASDKKDNFHMNSYKRQINMWLAKYEVWRSILR